MSASTRRKGPRRFRRVEGPGFAVALLASVIAIGAIGFHFIEGWDLWHALYATVLGVATVEIPPLSPAGQVFSLFVLFGGVGTALYTFTRLATLVVEGTLPRQLQRRRLARMLETVKDHFIICGYGRIGSTVARQFQRQGVPCVVIERDPARLQAALEAGLPGIAADSGSEDVLVQVGIARARGLVAAVGTDAENVYTVLSARVLRPDLYIVGRAETEDATLKLKRAGADRVVSPYQIGAVQMAQTALRPAVVDFVELATSSENLELAIEEVPIGADSGLAGHSILETNLRQRLGVIVVGIQRHDRSMEFNPSPETMIRSGDKLVVLGRPESFKQLESEAGH